MTECLQAHFAKFTGRDAAMSKSLNSDYLSQLYIRADTKSMDKDLVREEVATSGLPEEAQALVVFKRGCVPLLNLSIQSSLQVPLLLVIRSNIAHD